jgi:hypothetical protein
MDVQMREYANVQKKELNVQVCKCADEINEIITIKAAVLVRGQ